MSAEIVASLMAGLAKGAATFLGQSATQEIVHSRAAKRTYSIKRIRNSPVLIDEHLKTEISSGLGQLLRHSGRRSEARAELVRFLSSPQFDSLVRQTCAVYVIHGPKAIKGMTLIPFELATEISGLSEHAIDERLLFELYVTASQQYLRNFLRNSEHLKEEAAQALITSQLDSLIVLTELRNRRLHREVNPRTHADSIRPLLSNEFETIATPHWEAVQRLPLQDVYVERQMARSGAVRAEPIPMRLLVKGDPGGGKTTFLRKLAHDILSGEGERYGEATPENAFFVVLRDFQDSHATNIVSYLTDELQRLTGIVTPKDFVETQLLSGNVCVLFDGLDELLVPSDRQKIVTLIETFGIRFPNAPIIVTSRSVGYNEAPLSDKFSVWQIQDFDDRTDVPLYASKFFSSHPDIPSQEAKRITSSFMKTSTTVKDLRVNPLLLALLCNLYHATAYQDLPRTRAAVYEKCALTFFDRWDRRRRIIKDIEFERDFLPVVSALAYQIFIQGSNERGIPRPQLNHMAVKFIMDHKFDDLNDANILATELIKHCTGRAWVMTDVGIDAGGDSIYAFTHRTFLEFFAAKHLVRSYHNPAQMAKKLDTRLVKSGAIVADLAIEMKSRELNDGSAIILRNLVSRAKRHHTLRLGLLSLACRVLTTVPTPDSAIDPVVRLSMPYFESEEIDLRSLLDIPNSAGINQRVLVESLRRSLTTEVKVFEDASRELPNIWNTLRDYVHDFEVLDRESSGFWRA